MEMTVNNRFSILLESKRVEEKRNISILEVAEKTGISRKTLAAWEHNKVNRFDVPVIDALCEYFSVQPGDLFHYVKAEYDKTGKISVLTSGYKAGEKMEFFIKHDSTTEEVKAMLEQPPMRTKKSKPTKK